MLAVAPEKLSKQLIGQQRDRSPPHLSNEDASLIDNAMQSAGERGGLSATTVHKYTTRLRRLGNDLARNGQSISALDYDSLVVCAGKYTNPGFRTAVRCLAEYLDPARRRPRRPRRIIPTEDEALIENAARSSNRLAGSIMAYSASLRRFSEALNREGHHIVSLDHETLIRRAKELFPNDSPLMGGLNMIDEFRLAVAASGASRSGDAGLYPQDAALIDGALGQALKYLRTPTAELRRSAQMRATRLRNLSAWLKETGRESMAGRLNRSNQEAFGLRDDVVAFKLAGRTLHYTDLSHLRSYLELVGANQALGLQAPQQSALPARGAGWPSSPQTLPATPPTPSEGAWALLRQQMQEPTSPSIARARSDTYGGLASFVDLNAPTPSELRDDAHFAPALSARAPTGSYRGLSLVDLTTPTPSGLSDEAHSVRASPTSSSDAPIGTSAQAGSLHGRSGLALGDEEWLGDEHIAADYALLEQELQTDNPDLAARTRFADPLIANYHLRLGAPDVSLSAFQRMVFDRNGTDVADFLFLPVNDASATDPDHRGTHWSLLFVDRRDRESPVAYHYDSLRKRNGDVAAMLAQRLGARLELAPMAQQQNRFDCGVFLVDATRTLVGRLAQRQPPAGLRNLVADRQALQNRLRGCF
nr:hypothetical protein BDOA9_0206690 [Bradyrhizobium sp. DOA9]